MAHYIALIHKDADSCYGGGKFPPPRTIDELRADPDFQERAIDAAIAAVPFRMNIAAAA